VAVVTLGFVLIVRSAAELDVLNSVRPLSAEWNHVVKLELPRRVAPAPVDVDECAATSIALEDVPLHLCGNSARFPGFPLFLSFARPFRESGSLSLCVREQQLNRALNHLSCVAIGKLMTQEIHQLFKIVDSVLSDRDMQAISLRRQRDSDRANAVGWQSGHTPRDRPFRRLHTGRAFATSCTRILRGVLQGLLPIVSCRERPNDCSNIASWSNLGDELVYLPGRTPLRAAKYILVILLRQVRSELMDPRKVQLPFSDHVQNAGKTTGRAACSDALASLRFGHSMASDAEREHRWVSKLKIELSPIDFADVLEQLGRQALVIAYQGRESAE
jgi:hypothetical protein